MAASSGTNATGVEMAGSLAELRNTALRTSYPEIDPAQVRIRLVEQLPGLLTPYQPAQRKYAAAELAKRGVDIMVGTSIKEVTSDTILLGSGETLRSDLTVWAAGVQATSRRCRSATTTRGSWLPSAGGRPLFNWPADPGSAARSSGSPGWSCPW